MRRGNGVLIVVVTVLMTVATITIAQKKYKISPQDTMITVIGIGEKKLLYIRQESISPNTLSLGWSKLSAVYPSLWNVFICDNGTCYNNLPDSGTMAQISPGEFGFLSLHVNAYTVSGMGIVRYAVWDLQQPSLIDTLTWIITTFPTSIAIGPSSESNMYSNRKKIYLTQLTGLIGTQVVIFDLYGKHVLTKKIETENEVIDMSPYQDGVYLISLRGVNKQLKVFISN